MQGHDRWLEHPDNFSLECYAMGFLEGEALVSVQLHLRSCDACLGRLAQRAHFFWIVRQYLHDGVFDDTSSMEEEAISLGPDILPKPLLN